MILYMKRWNFLVFSFFQVLGLDGKHFFTKMNFMANFFKAFFNLAFFQNIFLDSSSITDRIGSNYTQIIRVKCLLSLVKPLNHQPHKMIKHTQTIRWQKPTDCLSVFDDFAGLTLKELKFHANLQVMLAWFPVIVRIFVKY